MSKAEETVRTPLSLRIMQRITRVCACVCERERVREEERERVTQRCHAAMLIIKFALITFKVDNVLMVLWCSGGGREKRK